MDVEVRPLRRGEPREAADVLVDALADDSSWALVVPDAPRRRAALRGLVGVALADAGPHARVAVRAGEVVGAAVWQPPGRYPMSPWRQVRAMPRVLAMAPFLRGRVRDLQRFGAAVDALFPADPVRYLQVLGVAPAAQGLGVGTALLREGLQRADAGGEDVYLETGKPANVAYYARHGFAPVAPGAPVADGGPVMWRMRRPAPR